MNKKKIKTRKERKDEDEKRKKIRKRAQFVFYLALHKYKVAEQAQQAVDSCLNGTTFHSEDEEQQQARA